MVTLFDRGGTHLEIQSQLSNKSFCNRPILSELTCSPGKRRVLGLVLRESYLVERPPEEVSSGDVVI